ncbi:MAG: hypothetical protein HY774_07230 [Acidobacteria bacterium]|nr:hypothetical protein [Acidobacteriota bacterium]
MIITEPDKQALMAAKAELRRQFKNVPGVQGFGIGEHSVRVYIQDTSLRAHIPEQINNIEVECIVEGDIRALAHS